jgi:hypothetical protein
VGAGSDAASVAICVGAIALRKTPAARAARVVAAVLLLGFTVVAGFSIGLFYLPAAFAMFTAALANSAPPRNTR